MTFEAMGKGNDNSRDKQARDRENALDLALSQIEKQYGKGAVMRLGERGGRVDVEAIPSGSLALDRALGIGGFPKGRIVEIYGPEGAGKTMVSLHAVREAQKEGGTAAFIDAEHALDVGFARRIGVDVDGLIISQPDSGEQALEIVDTLVRSGAFDIIVLDSVAALVPQAELDGEMGDSHMGLHARLMSQALRKLAASINRSRTCVIFINQLRMKIGVMFGNPETTTGGRALGFYASLRLDIRRVAQIKDGDDAVGSRTRVKVVKNKLAPPLPAGGVRPLLSGRPDRDVARGGHGRHRCRLRTDREERHVVFLQRRTSRAGPRKRQGVSRREQGDRLRTRVEAAD